MHMRRYRPQCVRHLRHHVGEAGRSIGDLEIQLLRFIKEERSRNVRGFHLRQNINNYAIRPLENVRG